MATSPPLEVLRPAEVEVIATLPSVDDFSQPVEESRETKTIPTSPAVDDFSPQVEMSEDISAVLTQPPVDLSRPVEESQGAKTIPKPPSVDDFSRPVAEFQDTKTILTPPALDDFSRSVEESQNTSAFPILPPVNLSRLVEDSQDTKTIPPPWVDDLSRPVEESVDISTIPIPPPVDLSQPAEMPRETRTTGAQPPVDSCRPAEMPQDTTTVSPPPPTELPPPVEVSKIKLPTPVDLSQPLEASLDNQAEAPQGIILHQMGSVTVTLLPDNTVVKSGRRIHLDERHALDLAAQLNLPVPRVYESERMANGDVRIRMDFVEGQGLDVVWPSMSAEQKLDICHQLRDIITTMRSIECPTGVIGSCNGGVVRDCRTYDQYIGGPFLDEAAFNAFILDVVGTISKPIYNAFASKLGTDHRLMFSHGDLSPHNIIVKDNKIMGLIDWEFAGWYPEYWDYVKFFNLAANYREWMNLAEEIFPQSYDDELVTCQAIMRWQ